MNRIIERTEMKETSYYLLVYAWTRLCWSL